MKNCNFTVVIPSYNPDEKLLSVVEGLEALGIDDIIVINDGSKSECLKYFDEVRQHKSCTLLNHEVNKGKGAALKTAFTYFLENREEKLGVVTADGDAQHRPQDIIACANDMQMGEPHVVLGVRDFSLPHVPKRSKVGNKITCMVFKLFVGMKLKDTQTGLRAIPTKYLKSLISIEGDRYEYETNMLLSMKDYSIPYSETIIETVYIEENQTSHFRKFYDSYRIYKLIFKRLFLYFISAVLSLIVEQFIQSGIYHFIVGKFSPFMTELCAFAPARVLSSILNFYLNRKYVFKEKENGKRSVMRYYTLWICQAIVTMVLNYLASTLLNPTGSTAVYTVISIAVKVVIALVSFRIQKDWVFKKETKEN